jgi:Na+/proline symporter
MLSAKDETHAFKATLFFALNATLVVWPWILTALCAYLTFGPLEDPEMGYPKMMAKAIPNGALGLCVACLAGAFMSTIDTHLNLGSLYVINDLYRRFWIKEASEKHYVFMARVAMILMLGLSLILSAFMDSVASAWTFLITFAGGAGVTWILRWFWWRVNAWTEFSAMLTSGLIATGLKWGYPDLPFGKSLIICVFGAMCVWIPTTFLTPSVEDDQLAEFVRRVRPGQWGWKRIHQKYNIDHTPYLKQAIIGWFWAVITLFSFNFMVGSILLGYGELALILSGISLFGIMCGISTWKALIMER